MRLFRTLGSVAVPMGAARTAEGAWEKTLYTSCFSANTLTYYHATYENPRIAAYPLSSCNLNSQELQILSAA